MRRPGVIARYRSSLQTAPLFILPGPIFSQKYMKKIITRMRKYGPSAQIRDALIRRFHIAASEYPAYRDSFHILIGIIRRKRI